MNDPRFERCNADLSVMWHLQVLWAKPIESLTHSWETKAWIAILLSFFVEVLNLFLQLVYIRPLIAAGIALLVVIDFVFGIYFALRRAEPIVLPKVKITLYKFFEYGMIIGAFAVLHNMSAGSHFEVISEVFFNGSIFFIGGTEVMSIVRHWQGDEANARHVLRRIVNIGRSPTGEKIIEEVIEDIPLEKKDEG